MHSGLYHCSKMAPTLADRWKTALWNPISTFLLNIFSIQTCVTTGLVCTRKRFFQTSVCKPGNQCKHQQLCVNFLFRGQFCCVDGLISASPRALSMRIGYLSFHLTWVLGPFVHGRLQTMKPSGGTFSHDIAPLIFSAWNEICFSHSKNAWERQILQSNYRRLIRVWQDPIGPQIKSFALSYNLPWDVLLAVLAGGLAGSSSDSLKRACTGFYKETNTYSS